MTTTIPALRPYRVWIKGDLAAARMAAGARTANPMRSVSVGPTSVHATLFVDRDVLDRWFADSHDRAPGALLFYLGR